ncbi:MAG TPA: hypothetical protein PLQ93_12355, partial [Bacteroidia bacterium]|nr:hypothetical protein [Bacteroidia bacterium]
MRHFRLHLPVLITLFLLGNTVLAQENNRGIFSKIFPGDSLAGFNEDEFKQMAREEGLYGDAYLHFIELRKRFYIDTKYGLKEYFQNPVDPNSEEYKEMIKNAVANPFLNGKIIGGGNAINVAPCVNEGFELNNMTGWTYSVGTNFNSYAYPVTSNSVAFPSNTVMIVPTPTTDAIIGGIPNSPFSGSKVLKLGDSSPNGSLVKIAQTFPVNSNNFLYEFAYLAVSGYSAPHTCSQQPYMRVILKDFVGNILPCPNFTFATPNPTAVCSTTGITTWVSGGSGGGQYYYNPSWQKYSIDLTSYISSTVTIEVIVSDCVPTGHFMYAYFDSNCSALGVTLNNTVTIPAPTSTVNVAGQCAQVATLSAPGGLGPYIWNGPPLSGITNNTNQTISASIAGDYTLSMNPPGSCLPIVRVVKMSFPPPTTITASPSATICTSGSNTITTLSAVGAAQYTWMPGGSTATSIAFSPTTTTIYTLTARTGTCVGDYTFQVTVAPNPNLVVLSSNLSLCPGQTATLTGSGASTYSWAPVGLTGSLVTVTQTATTTYTTIGTSSDGCVSTATTAIVQTTLLPASVIQIGGPTGTVCPFTPLTFVAINASTFTWMPTGYVGNPAVLTPSATTNYTVIGSSGSCTNSAMFTVTVDPGPSMTITASPTLICPGNSVTITANAPASLGFTWSPVVSNASFIVVSPTVSTTYSVSGINALGCISTYTFAPLIAPIPVLTISPSSPTFCAGSILSLTATGGSSYTWNPGGLTGSVVGVSPASNTTYSIVGSNGTCTNSAQTSVTVVPLPNVTAGSSTASICNGSTLSLNAGGATSYSWSPGGLSGSPVIVSPTLSTTYTVTGLQGSCTNTATVAITVNYGPTLNPVASPTAICPGFVSNLSASGASGYTWNPGALAGANVTVSPAASTVYSVTGSTALGCLSTQTVNLVVNPNPTIGITASNASVC